MGGVRVRNVRSGAEEVLPANGLFYAVGHEPATGLVKGQLRMDEDGYLVTEPGTGKTGVPGVFAAGDVQDKRYRQAITSAGEYPPSGSSLAREVKPADGNARIRLHRRARGREVAGGARRRRRQRARDRGGGQEAADQRPGARVPLQPPPVTSRPSPLRASRTRGPYVRRTHYRSVHAREDPGLGFLDGCAAGGSCVYVRMCVRVLTLDGAGGPAVFTNGKDVTDELGLASSPLPYGLLLCGCI